MTRKGRVRWQSESGHWSDWYNLGEPLPEWLNNFEVIAVHIEEEMTKEEYQKLYEDN